MGYNYINPAFTPNKLTIEKLLSNKQLGKAIEDLYNNGYVYSLQDLEKIPNKVGPCGHILELVLETDYDSIENWQESILEYAVEILKKLKEKLKEPAEIIPGIWQIETGHLLYLINMNFDILPSAQEYFGVGIRSDF